MKMIEQVRRFMKRVSDAMAGETGEEYDKRAEEKWEWDKERKREREITEERGQFIREFSAAYMAIHRLDAKTALSAAEVAWLDYSKARYPEEST